MTDAAWLVPLGFAAGMPGSMAGLGGGVVIVPVLTLLGAPPAARPDATSTSRRMTT